MTTGADARGQKEAVLCSAADYDAFLARVERRFAASIRQGEPLFTTDAEGLWEAFLESFPAEVRQENDCHACRTFIQRYGSLVTIDDRGLIGSALWHAEDAPREFSQAIGCMAQLVQGARVRGVFLTPLATLGRPRTGVWSHFSVTVPTVLSEAKQIEIWIPERGDFTAIVTVADLEAPPILQWDLPERRNPFSWYLYNGGSDASSWGLRAESWEAVGAVTLKPSMWGGEKYSRQFSHQGVGVIFVIPTARDLRVETAGGGLFPEFLKSELREVRSTIEAYSRTAVIAERDATSASGLMLVKGSNELRVRVVTASNTRIAYHIDRWD